MADDPKMRLTEFLSGVKRKLLKGETSKVDGTVIKDEILNERNIKTNYPTKETMLYCMYNDFLAKAFGLPVYEQIGDDFKEHLMSYKGWKTEVNLKAMTFHEDERLPEGGRRFFDLEEE